MTETAGWLAYRTVGISWCAIRAKDIESITSLMRACLAADGGLPLAAEEGFVCERFLTRPNGSAIGGFDVYGRMVAAAAPSRIETPKAYMASAVGAVHPEARGRGIGTALFEWIEAEALRLLADAPLGDSVSWTCRRSPLRTEPRGSSPTTGLRCASLKPSCRSSSLGPVLRIHFPRASHSRSGHRHLPAGSSRPTRRRSPIVRGSPAGMKRDGSAGGPGTTTSPLALPSSPWRAMNRSGSSSARGSGSPRSACTPRGGGAASDRRSPSGRFVRFATPVKGRRCST